MAPGGVAQSLHFEQANLVKAPGEDVNNVPVMCRPLREIIIELVHRLVVYRRHGASLDVTLSAFL